MRSREDERGRMDLVHKAVIPTNVKAAREAAEQVVARAEACGYSPESVFAIKLALEEALMNAIKHGNRRDPDKRVRLEYSVNPAQVRISVVDQGNGFDPAAVPDPTADENLECPTGRGIMLMRAYMDHVEFSDSGSAVQMVKYNS